MSKIRINELARELEVKPNVILDILPELGVGDKKTHSSSLDDDVVLAIRRRIAGEGSSTEFEPAAQQKAPDETPRPSSHHPASEAPPAPSRTEAHVAAAPPKEFEKETSVAEEYAAPVRPTAPIRPPLA